MAVLLDTNALLWALDDDTRLGPRARDTLVAGQNIVISVVSLWEIAIKVSVGKLESPPALFGLVDQSGAQRLSIADAHLDQLSHLPLLHRDPFDRMLIAQAQAEGLTVMTSDAVFDRYAVTVLDARS